MKFDKDDWKLHITIFLWAFAITAILALMVSCKCTHQPVTPIPVIHEVHDTIKSVEYRDSIVFRDREVRDSSSFRQSGDTIRIERWHWERDYRYEKILQAKIDSLSKIKRDSIPYPVPSPPEYIEKPLKGWQKGLIWWGIFCTLALAIVIYIRVRIPILRKRS